MTFNRSDRRGQVDRFETFSARQRFSLALWDLGLSLLTASFGEMTAYPETVDAEPGSATLHPSQHIHYELPSTKSRT